MDQVPPTPARPQSSFTRLVICVFTGFSSGLPLYLLLVLVPAWLRTEHVDLKVIGVFTLIQFPYTWKFLWSPLVDRYSVTALGRRRGWMLVAQVGLLATIASLGAFSPQSDLRTIVVISTLLAFLSATQDIALDAYRRELLPDKELGLGNAMFVNAYRIGGLIPASLSLILADHLPWNMVFIITALFMLPGVVLTMLIAEPATVNAPRTLRHAVVEPFREFLGRKGWQGVVLILGFLFFYKLGDNMCTALATPFYLDMGFSKTQIGLVAKNAGLWPSVIGGILGGIWMLRLGINRALWIFGLVQVTSIVGFYGLSLQGVHTQVTASHLIQLGFVIGLEALGVGLGSAALAAFIAHTTNPAYAATQVALFTSLMVVPRSLVSASSGWLIEQLGWSHYFLLCTTLAIPGMLLLLKVAPWNGEASTR